MPATPGNDQDLPACPLCGRPIPPESRSEHHLVPKSLKGREHVVLHRICHRKIHSLFTERELARIYNTIGRLLEHPDVRVFRTWVAGKPPNFYAPTFDNRRKRRR